MHRPPSAADVDWLPPDNVRRVLVVDDDEYVGVQLIGILNDLGLETELSRSGVLQATLDAFDPDLILLDVRLKVSDAFTILRLQIPSDYRGVVSIMSGMGLDVIMDVMLLGERLGLRMGSPAPKPFSPNDLRQVVLAADQLFQRKLLSASARAGTAPATLAGALTLRQALDTHRLEVWYQPQFDAATGRIAGAEALIRGRDFDGAIVSPYALLRDATRDDMLDLTDFVLKEAISHMTLLAAVGFDRKLSVNVPVSYLSRPDPALTLREAAVGRRWPGLTFEVTEDEALGDVVELQMVATQLRLYSVTLSIDDFGAAYSSLARLRDLPFQELKLDRSFVHGCAINSTKRAICTNVLALGAELGVITVAEGIENETDMQLLIDLGCDRLQGFYLARPMPFADLLQLVKNWRPAALHDRWGAQRSITADSQSDVERLVDVSAVSDR